MSELGENVSECPACGDASVTFRETDISFAYGAAPNQVEIHAQVPKGFCASCGFEFTDQRAEQLKHEAICEHFGLMKPKQIAALRKAWSMTRQRFAEVTKIGEASLSRWERGAGLQNGALDQYLFLLGFSNNIERLLKRENRSEVDALLEHVTEDDDFPGDISSRFSNLKDIPEKKKESRLFHLRCAGE